MFFVLVPVFAVIVAMFYRRPFPQHLVFALHLHAGIFIATAALKLVNFTKMPWLIGTAQAAGAVFVLTYGLLAFRRVYADSWPRILAKSLGIGVLYLVASVMAMLAAVAWAAWIN